jgi:SAM-dependent methyltransferase
MNDVALLADLHRRQGRQGPGGDAETHLAITLAGLSRARSLKIADIGCGTGASTFVLARTLDADITAVDLLPEFLEDLRQRADEEELGGRIATLCASMNDLPFEPASLDVIWSEGAIYNIGFETGIQAWRRFLKPGGILAVSELTWLSNERPDELDEHWAKEYPEVATASAKLGVLEAHGYSPIGYFALSERCWMDNYYLPLREQLDAFLARHDNSDAVRAIVASERAEMSLYERFSAFVSYGYYVARRQ